jgi:voltage-gated potassium channel
VISEIVFYSEVNIEGHNINSHVDAYWWGLVTLLTVGYGDKFPVSDMGRLFAGLLMLSGVASIAVVTAKISSFFLERALSQRRGIVNSEELFGHYIICGWKDEMANLLMYILDSNPELSSAKLVLINNMDEKEIESLLAVPRLKHVKIIRGDFWLEVNLKKAAPERATKILILADATPMSNGEIPTITEADARTVMTAMTINSIAKGTEVVAELLDAVMDQYLRLAQVHEIIYSRDTSRLMLAMSSTGTGVSNIFQALLNPRSNINLVTRRIPDELFNLPYADFLTEFTKIYPHKTLLGILENSGNSHQAKEYAIKRAQQTPNIGQLVENLTAVKALRFNQPVFSPSEDYVVKEGSMAIVIERKTEASAPV